MMSKWQPRDLASVDEWPHFWMDLLGGREDWCLRKRVVVSRMRIVAARRTQARLFLRSGGMGSSGIWLGLSWSENPVAGNVCSETILGRPRFWFESPVTIQWVRVDILLANTKIDRLLLAR